MNQIRVLGNHGDKVAVEWNPSDTKQTEHAKDIFEQMLGSGYAMFTPTDTIPEQIRHFPTTAKEILAVPQLRGG